MKKKDLKNKKFVYHYDNIKEVCDEYGSIYYLINPDDPEFIIVNKLAKFCGYNDKGEEDWEIEGKKYSFVPYLDGSRRFLRTSREVKGVIMEEGECKKMMEEYE